jgi:hypothetical protein
MADMTPIGWVRDRSRSYATMEAAPPPDDAHADRVVYGLVQPLVGLKVLFTDGTLLRLALIPALGLTAFCVLVGATADHGGHLRRFYNTFAALAPLPSIVFAPSYARIAALAHERLGFGARRPLIDGLLRALWRAAAQAVLIAVALLPATAALGLIPLFGWMAVKLIAALWALHWIVVDALDGARTLRDGETLADVDRANLLAQPPWFVRLARRGAAHSSGVARRALERFAGFCDYLARPFREEIALAETHPSLISGFALATALLLATPVLNLFFRPIIVVAAVNLTSRLHPDRVRDAAPAVGADAVFEREDHRQIGRGLELAGDEPGLDGATDG